MALLECWLLASGSHPSISDLVSAATSSPRKDKTTGWELKSVTPPECGTCIGRLTNRSLRLEYVPHPFQGCRRCGILCVRLLICGWRIDPAPAIERETLAGATWFAHLPFDVAFPLCRPCWYTMLGFSGLYMYIPFSPAFLHFLVVVWCSRVFWGSTFEDSAEVEGAEQI